MDTIYTVAWMQEAVREAGGAGRVIGLVPTMGALHQGHFSLVRAARKECSPVIVSIFVNPKQFGPSEDLSRYPRSLEEDCAALQGMGVDYAFVPTVAEMYPDGFQTRIEVGELSARWEGRSRSGHFAGVATVVLKLFEIVRPNFAYFGRKDAQQSRIVCQMAADLNLHTQVIVCPIVREADGLALSSRNAYLNPEERKAATVLHRGLWEVEREIKVGERHAARLLDCLRQVLASEPRVKLDYAELVDSDTWQPVVALRRSCLLLIAAYVGATRLIDNALIEQAGANGEKFLVTV